MYKTPTQGNAYDNTIICIMISIKPIPMQAQSYSACPSLSREPRAAREAYTPDDTLNDALDDTLNDALDDTLENTADETGVWQCVV